MRKADQYRVELQALADWEPYLKAHSGLPGPRGNLELVEAVGDIAPAARLWVWSESDDEFLAVCGAAGLGRFGFSDAKVLPRLRDLAGDSRWRVREGVAMALQRMGRQDMPRLIAEMDAWTTGTLYEQRAVAAGLCEPALLQDPKQAKRVLATLHRITRSIATARNRKTDEFRVLRQALGYCWSVAAAASPEDGRVAMERWFSSEDPDVRWIMRTNLAKSRMKALGARWTGSSLKKVG